MPNPLRIDPTRTTLLRRAFMADMQRRFRLIAQMIYDAVMVQDVFDLKPRQPLKLSAKSGLPVKAFQFKTNDVKLAEFNAWLKTQIDQHILEAKFNNTPWMNKYIDSAYRKGTVRAYTDFHKKDLATKGQDFYSGGQAGFLQRAFSQPERTSKIRLLYARSYEELKGITAAMSQQISRTIAGGLASGDGPFKIAKELKKNVDGITSKRALVLARTETIHAHAEGALDTMEDLGLKKTKVRAEWSTAGDGAVCEICVSLEGEIYEVSKAHGLIPAHPNCRCAWIPYDEEISAAEKSYQARKKAGVSAEDAIGKIKIIPPEELVKKGPIAFPSYGLPPVEPLPLPPPPPPPVPPPLPKPPPPITPKVVQKPVIAPKPKPPAPIAPTPPPPIAQPGLPAGYTRVDTKLGGSTGAQLVADEKGYKWVLKTYGGNEAQVVNEFTAARIYNDLGNYYKGAYVPNVKLVTVDGKQAILSRYQPGAKTLGNVTAAQQVEAITQLRKTFATDAWLANWDVIGLEMDNVIVTDAGTIFKIDQGGALKYRAQGALKGSKFGSAIPELKTLRDASANPAAAKVFGGMTEKDVLDSITLLQERVDSFGGITKYLNSDRFVMSDPETKKILYQRYSAMINYRNNTEAMLKAAAQKQAEAEAAAAAAKKTKTQQPRKSVGTIPAGEKGKTYKDYAEGFDAAEAMRLPPNEFKVVNDYSHESYQSINQKAVKGNIDESLKDLDRALERLPKYDGYTIRGITDLPNTEEMWKKWITGEWGQVEWSAYSSTSAKQGAEFSATSGITFVIKGKNGAIIQPLSHHKHEVEVLFGRNSKFRVTGWSVNPNTPYRKGNPYNRVLLIEEDANAPVSQLAPKKMELEEILSKMDKFHAPDLGEL